MKKLSYLLFSLVLMTTVAKAQYVNIPDSNFRKYLQLLYPACFNSAHQMDTTCTAIINATSLTFNTTPPIKDLDGVQYFDKLKYLNCSGFGVTNIPRLPSTLTTLYCASNQLTSLPALPSGLTYLYCPANHLTSLPSLPSTLISLTCDANDIYCLPRLPNNLQTLIIDYGKINCLPNLTNARDTFGTVVNLPLCNPTNNVNQCQSYPLIYGKVFTDLNNNGVKDANEYYRPYVKLTLNTGESVFTNLNGVYAMSMDNVGTFTLTTEPPAFYTAIPGSNTFSFTGYNTALTLPDIALVSNTIRDSLAVAITPVTNRARPGFAFSYNIVSENVGTLTNTSTVNLKYDTTRLVYDSSSVAILSNTNDIISISNGSLVPGQINNVRVYFTVKTSAVLGDSLTASVDVMGGGTIASSHVTVAVRASYDPNDKRATPAMSPTQVTNGEYVDYTIHFQNTGNDTAFTVVLADTLSPLLRSNVLQMVGTSHPCNITINNGVIYFEFLKINLPDSNTNKNLSQGYVSFKLKPVTNIALGSFIDNKASIYFDYNAPIVTNTARTVIKTGPLPVSIKNYEIRTKTDGNKVQVVNEWTTGVEINASHFNVQRSQTPAGSTTGNDFKAVGKVEAKGTASTYTFNDPLAISAPTIVYYRLQIVDKDGKISYSETKQLVIKPQSSDISLYPNPAKNTVTAEGKDIVQISIFDNTGRLVLSKSRTNTTEDQFKLTLGLKSGIYMAKILLSHGRTVSEKLIVE